MIFRVVKLYGGKHIFKPVIVLQRFLYNLQCFFGKWFLSLDCVPSIFVMLP